MARVRTLTGYKPGQARTTLTGEPVPTTAHTAAREGVHEGAKQNNHGDVALGARGPRAIDLGSKTSGYAPDAHQM